MPVIKTSPPIENMPSMKIRCVRCKCNLEISRIGIANTADSIANSTNILASQKLLKLMTGLLERSQYPLTGRQLNASAMVPEIHHAVVNTINDKVVLLRNFVGGNIRR
jgi:hypothetical protein